MAFLVVLGAVIVVALVLAAWYDRRMKRRGEQVDVTLKRPWRGGRT